MTLTLLAAAPGLAAALASRPGRKVKALWASGREAGRASAKIEVADQACGHEAGWSGELASKAASAATESTGPDRRDASNRPTLPPAARHARPGQHPHFKTSGPAMDRRRSTDAPPGRVRLVQPRHQGCALSDPWQDAERAKRAWRRLARAARDATRASATGDCRGDRAAPAAPAIRLASTSSAACVVPPGEVTWRCRLGASPSRPRAAGGTMGAGPAARTSGDSPSAPPLTRASTKA